MKSIDLSAVDLNLLVAFEALYLSRSVTAAAQRLHLGQPAMSAALGRLRSLFDDDLFVRVGREMKPTARAAAIAPQVASALAQIRATLASPSAFDPAVSERTFTIATSDYLASMILPGLLGMLHQQAPHINLQVVPLEKDAFVAPMDEGRLDVALGTFPSLPLHLRQHTLLAEAFVGLARQGHPAVTDGQMALADFVRFPHALFTLRRDAVGVVDQALAAQGWQRRIALTVPYWFALPAAIAASDMLVAMPSHLATHLTRHYSLQAFAIPLPLLPWSVTMVWSQLSDRDPANAWLRQTLQQTVRLFPSVEPAG